MQRIKDVVSRLLFLASWIRAHGEIAVLYAEDLTFFIRRRHQFGPPCRRRIDDVASQDCYTLFGHNWHNLQRLHQHLRVPDNFTMQSRHVYGGEECFIVYLYHLKKGTPFTEMACFIFGNDPCCLLEMNDLFISHGYYTFYIKISGTSLDQWIPQN